MLFVPHVFFFFRLGFLQVTAGMAMYDTMQYIQPEVCMGTHVQQQHLQQQQLCRYWGDLFMCVCERERERVGVSSSFYSEWEKHVLRLFCLAFVGDFFLE